MEAMPYTQSLLANGMAIGYHAKAAPPTVTMPRLKAMVSGAVGGFLDVAFNFNTQALLDDNLLGQFFSIGWKMVMLGDETWLKLFPGLFTRQDGVGSFFVKDTVQVDQNVSRHLGDELSRDDWNLLILHYLGLDHVGHIGGRNSVLMAPKLLEMDQIVKIIHTSIIQMQESDQGNMLLLVVSDHGMTESGNHGGSSSEETDSLALFIGLRNHVSDYASATRNTAHQVDIAPTLALLFGVPIPKNNIGVLISETFDSLKDDHRLRALELNSWQLLRLLQAQSLGLSCGNIPCNGLNDSKTSGTVECNGSSKKMLCCLYMNAAVLHNSWKSEQVSEGEAYRSTVAAYHKFLKTASEWLSGRATDKSVNVLASGVAAMLLSCLIFLSLILHMCREVKQEKKQHLSNLDSHSQFWHLEETFVLGVIFILAISMTSSSMVEEEHYIWHFMTSTLYLLLLRKTAQFLLADSRLFKGQSINLKVQMSFVFVLLISGRILRGWHQGGVNWTYLPDISKWLEQGGNDVVKAVQLVSGVMVIFVSLYALSFFGSKKMIVQMVGINFSIVGLLVLQYVMKYQDNTFAPSSDVSTLLAQIIYAILGSATVGTVIVIPWLIPLHLSYMGSSHNIYLSTLVPKDVKKMSPLMEMRDSLYVIGWSYIVCWCFLQLMLQQPINSMPILLLLVQIITTMLYSSYGGLHLEEWVEVSALCFLGMAGHFALGNSNTLATIDVAGAFIGISSHSTLLSGILMFSITYASPMLALLSMVVYISVKSYLVVPQNVGSEHLLKTMLGFPCLVPLGINSILLTAYTTVLLLMRNHLFVWSVFSPKYLYVCATTVCIYVGVAVVAATGMYTYLVLTMRKRNQVSIINDAR
ncbi:GPI ethanolamine phosphate transferase 2 isoform X4 [Mangifera indica]|nr:GPI ethanolamine phosphate transferase 2 isoform X4 [Mangifera indica]XP_044500910.1 GPI ethanolamine phosphate transferase 2 isoform X4 [Mangifera indica]XP_044500911.1 GPI ethanolamine phosphate transferase 2 isoform X4 [Mangifera indica]XP_044500912.1 GPI ethanolamine phosphate transferase 2 isoform X4 [Mangifera indica]XP_044500913.1 GPI ethanolamine phosphate transferase 2 isoform X4 [Mangifera indica]